MGEKIRLEMNDWLYNAGLVGLYNVLKHSGDKVDYAEQYVELDVSLLENFEEKYFRYFIDKYQAYLSYFKIISYERTIKYHEDNDFETFEEEDLESLNNYIKNVVKYYLSSNSYRAAYEIINDEVDMLELAKELQVIKIKKKESIKDKVGEIKNIFQQLKVMINCCKKDNYRKYLAAKNVIYTIIKHSWDGVSFLNPQTKEKDIYLDYQNYFIEPVNKYMTKKATSEKFNCFTCGRSIKDLKNDLSFLNNIGFDVSRKSSHTWNFSNDVAVCPICKLVLSCTPAGITYVYDKGIYINDNNSFQDAVNINNKVKSEILKEFRTDKLLTYRALVNSIQEQFQDKMKYELADIQVVRYEEGQYKFNILSKQALYIIRKSQGDLNNIIHSGFKEINTYFNIYELVINRILNNHNLFTLIQKLLVYKLSNPKDCRFNALQLISILNINFRCLEGMGYMKSSDKDIIKNANISGYYLREQYKEKGAQDKLNGISYRLLNALKTNNKDMFMDTLLNCYLYSQKTVPSIFLEALKDDEKYKTIGYAFVTGLIEGKESMKKNGGDE
ncbi:CRISPR-associated protein Csx8 [Clostridium aceticum]|uniref:CRISPR-associated protein Csx8 n=1 Tax=Clostridium aceticum TaxID=84022 RepID=A0A0D8I9M8_9CLOT|nr:CRISPR-associated protein Csx8 [Clostridium aceticum]KJF26764.1 CRISPR-associated protein Cst1 [Clostridium aceticum]